MEKIKKLGLPIISGIAYGYLGFWWMIYSLMFAFPGTSPGSRDWEEDVFFIPIGYAMLIAFAVTFGIIVFKNRKRKTVLLLFILAAVLTAGIVFGIKYFLG